MKTFFSFFKTPYKEMTYCIIILSGGVVYFLLAGVFLLIKRQTTKNRGRFLLFDFRVEPNFFLSRP